MTKKQIIKTAVFISIFLWLLVTITYVIRMNGDVKDRFAGFYAEPDNSISAVIIGSSPVYPCYATPKLWEDTGIPCYLISSNMQRPTAGLYLVREVLKSQRPDLFIFEMRMYTGHEADMTANMAHTREVTDNMRYSWNRVLAINALVPDMSERYTYYFDIFKYHSNWKTMILPSQIRDFDYSYPDDLKGYVTEDKVGPSAAHDVTGISGSLPIEDIQDKALDDIINELKANDAKALFIVTPYLLTDEDQQKYNYISNKVNDAGYNFLNMNEYYDEIGIDFATDFTDYGNHVNAQGGRKVTEFLGKYLQSGYDLEDMRGNKAYSSWDAAAKLYEDQYKEAEAVISKRVADKDWTVLDN